MKVAIFSESPADEAALRILVDTLCGCATEPVGLTRFAARRGWPNVELQLAAVFKHLYFQTDADGLVAVADSNGTPVHRPDHDPPQRAAPLCRLCRLRTALEQARREVRPRPARQPLHTAVGLATPAVEAWYRCGIDPHATEAAWTRDLAAGAQARGRIQTLKVAVYGTDRPSLAQEIEAATAAARRLAVDIAALENDFACGFGRLACEIRAWPRPG